MGISYLSFPLVRFFSVRPSVITIGVRIHKDDLWIILEFKTLTLERRWLHDPRPGSHRKPPISQFEVRPASSYPLPSRPWSQDAVLSVGHSSIGLHGQMSLHANLITLCLLAIAIVNDAPVIHNVDVVTQFHSKSDILRRYEHRQGGASLGFP
jgi:hypothetical protein